MVICRAWHCHAPMQELGSNQSMLPGKRCTLLMQAEFDTPRAEAARILGSQVVLEGRGFKPNFFGKQLRNPSNLVHLFGSERSLTLDTDVSRIQV